jgi:nucleoside-diphosphate-sugar epimerase
VNKILLVGGAGYVGSVLAQELVERGFAVRVLDRFYFGAHGLDAIRDQVEVVQGDMRAVPPAVLDDVHTVVNIGGLSNDPTAEYNPKANFEMNTTASIRLAQQCQERGVPRYLYASSCSIYDRGVADEERDVLLDETANVDPRAAYSSSKHAAERALLAMASPAFTVAAMRKGTLYGYSPRMRYDLVVNTFVKDCLSQGSMTLHYGGEMWRPLVDVRDAARAYVRLIQAAPETINGQLYNLVYRNFRISEVALRVREALRALGLAVDIRTDYSYKGVRNYRVSGRKMEVGLKFRPEISIEESVENMVKEIRRANATDFDNPRYYNIRWIRALEEAQNVISVTGTVF